MSKTLPSNSFASQPLTANVKTFLSTPFLSLTHTHTQPHPHIQRKHTHPHPNIHSHTSTSTSTPSHTEKTHTPTPTCTHPNIHTYKENTHTLNLSLYPPNEFKGRGILFSRCFKERKNHSYQKNFLIILFWQFESNFWNR